VRSLSYARTVCAEALRIEREELEEFPETVRSLATRWFVNARGELVEHEPAQRHPIAEIRERALGQRKVALLLSRGARTTAAESRT
jgi:hypothetical protein